MRTTLRPGNLKSSVKGRALIEFSYLATGVGVSDQNSPVARIIWVEVIRAAKIGLDPLSHHLRKFAEPPRWVAERNRRQRFAHRAGHIGCQSRPAAADSWA